MMKIMYGILFLLLGTVCGSFASFWGIDDYFCQIVLINDSMKPVWVVTQDRGVVAELATFVKTNSADVLLPGERWRIIAPAYVYEDATPSKNVPVRTYRFDTPFSSMDRIAILYEDFCKKIRKTGNTDVYLSALKNEYKKIMKAEEIEQQQEELAYKAEEAKDA